ncbi:MAG TPA: alpha/beta fold hydrolase [Candidatus Angelobacter sp.]|jgi:dipeptidyl aminopeptidase/acylaminoacyl peptidase|nr:alpha/beta fold hydrolase [Candidatus Angelobacter sp.]
MNKLFKSLMCLVLLAATLGAADKDKKTPTASGLPPIIDRELIFGNPEIAAPQLSPDGKYLAFLKPWKDTRNVYVKGVDEPFSAARLLTTESKRPIAGYFWTHDSKYILFVKDNDGDENYNVYAVDPAAKPAPGADAPASRDMTGLKGVRVQLVEVPKNDPDTIYIGLNDRDKAWHDLYKLKISTGEKTLVRKNTERISGWVFDRQGNLRLAERSAENGDTEILRVDPDKFTKIYSCSVFEQCNIVRFHKDGKRAYMATNKGPDMDLAALALIDPETGKTEIVESDPLKRVDFTGAIFSEVTDELALTQYLDDHLRRYFKDKDIEAGFQWLRAKFPGKEVGRASWTKDEQTWVVGVNSDTEPGETYLFDRKTHKLALQYRVREKLPREALAEMKVVHYKSSDGLEIPAYLTLPKGIPAKNLPTIIFPHGGPWGRDVWGYNPYAQFFANRGYAVLSMNFRGSAGYGKKFIDAGNNEWGKKMQDDVTWGEKYLVAEGISDPKRIGIFGGSYGGYATLAGVAFTPDVYAAAVDLFGPSNLITLLDSIPPYWESGRQMFYQRMGNPTTPEGKALLVERSPLTSASKIKTPLMIAQGANDPRVNHAESEQIVVALRDRGFPVEYLLIPDEGHGFARPVNNMASIMATEKFFAKYLGGRAQEGGTPEVVARLKEVTVDPKTVVLAKKVDANAVGLPKAAVDLQPGTFKYKATIEVGGQTVPLSVSTTIAEDGGGWTATDVINTPNGEVTQISSLEKGTLIARKLGVKQGPVSIDLSFADNKATGNMNANGQDRAISVDMGGPLFAEGAGAKQSLSCLPLVEGYTTTYRNFDVQQQKVKLMQLKVTGVEKVTVPAGTFDAYKLEITSADGGADKETLWVAKDSRKPVKESAVLAAMGGAVLTQELLQ